MAKRKATKKTSKAGAKKTARGKRPAPKETVPKKTTQKKAAKQPVTKKRSVAKTKRTIKNKSPSLGRPKVTGDEKLYMLFKEDYHARQIFEFLRVESVRELEQFSPKEIIRLLSQPLQTTVERIRRKLAEKNRFLADDKQFVLAQKTQDKDAG